MKILVVFTGGTIGSTEMEGYISPDSEKSYRLINMFKDRAEGKYPDIDFEIQSPYQMLSENNTCENLRKLASFFSSVDYNQYDGIIVTHGTDTLQYTSAFLGYILKDIKIPVVLVSANYILEDERSNGLDNFYYAVRFIADCGDAGVFVSYKNTGRKPQIHVSTRLLKHEIYKDDIYSVDDAWYGYFEDGIFYKNKALYNNIPYSDIEFELKNDNWESGIMLIEPYVGMRYPLPDSDVKAVLHGTYHSGTMCSKSPDIEVFVLKAKEFGIPVFLIGAGEGADYESKKCYRDFGFEILPKASPAAMYIKLWLCLESGYDTDKIKEIMLTDIAGDILKREE